MGPNPDGGRSGGRAGVVKPVKIDYVLEFRHMRKKLSRKYFAQESISTVRRE